MLHNNSYIHPTDIQNYNMCTYDINGMYIKIKGNDNIMYLFDIETGNVYVSKCCIAINK